MHGPLTSLASGNAPGLIGMAGTWLASIVAAGWRLMQINPDTGVSLSLVITLVGLAVTSTAGVVVWMGRAKSQERKLKREHMLLWRALGNEERAKEIERELDA